MEILSDIFDTLRQKHIKNNVKPQSAYVERQWLCVTLATVACCCTDWGGAGGGEGFALYTNCYVLVCCALENI